MTLAEKGYEIHRRQRGVPDHFQVFGERSSGTNYVDRLLARNTVLRSTSDYGWKHGFAQMTGVARSAIIVAVVRDPVGWALSMHAKPWHCPPALQALDFPAFLRSPWTTVIDRPRYFGGDRAAGRIGTPLQQDRHPITGAPFANLAELRRVKAAALLGWRNRGVNLVLARLDHVQANPEAFVVAVSEAFDLRPVESFRPINRRLGSRFLPNVEDRPATPRVMTPEDRTWFAQALDPRLEAALGYALPA
ncbi:hypothetical protein [uncultured Maritimibacter sp.]|jgi:hypothetical protein|uniref:hypothetical protein n=1 Tax=uncultured Maritimibacter sp. TaxID=991866 RepID=UPI002636DE78|nr:hypothetical protein [uncultured Maritimibacter sp.]